MHMADALIAPAVAATMFTASATTAGHSVKKLNTDEQLDKAPLMGVLGAFVFAAQMVNFSIPATGSSGHLCGGLLLAALLGPHAGFLTMVSVLTVQCLIFADGGLLALGCNIWNMAFYPCFIGYLFLFRPITKKGFSPTRIFIGSLLGSVLSLQLGAFSVVLESSLSNISELPFLTFVAFMQPIHLIIGIVEGLITATVLTFIYQARPALLESPGIGRATSAKTVIFSLALTTLVIGGGLSLLASTHPDGLEWAILKVSGLEELPSGGTLHNVFADIQGKTALLDGYSVLGADSAIGTSFSGVAGALMVSVILISFYGRQFYKTNPTGLFLTTLVYLTVLMSARRYSFGFLCLLALFPLCLLALHKIPFFKALRDLKIGMFFVLLMSLGNPLVNRTVAFRWRNVSITYGMLSGISMFLKGFLALVSVYVLVQAVTPDGLCALLRKFHVPGVLVVTISLILRYLHVLKQETKTMADSYQLRAGKTKGIQFREWGSFLGGLLLRTYDRSKVLYESMQLRGYDGTLVWEDVPMTWTDALLCLVVCAVLVIGRLLLA